VSHGFVHVVEIGATVDIFGLTVSEGDLVHADRHGALVVPEHVLPDLEEAINSIIANEAIILDPARETCFDIDKLEAAWAQFEARRI
jgi:regulator of RNase E activity RraA